MEHKAEKELNSMIRPKKERFKFKRKENGLFLTIHHTITENGNTLRIRLILATFVENNSCLVTIDHRGNIFAFDLISKKFWKMFDKIPKSTALSSMPKNSLKCLVSTRNGDMKILNIELGIIEKSKKLSLYSIDGISISSSTKSSNNFLAYSIHEAFIIDLNSLESKYRLDFNENRFSLKFVSFIPDCDRILTCLTNDTIHVWSGINFNTIRILYPIKMRNRYLKHTDCEILELPETEQTDDNLNIILKDMIIKDTTKGIINSISFSSDGRYVCLTFIDDYLMVLTVGDFEIIKLIQLKGITFKRVEFISQTEMLLFALTTTSDVILIDSNNLKTKIIVNDGKSYKFGMSTDGQMCFIILTTGEVNLYKTSITINLLKSTEKCSNVERNRKIQQTMNDEIFDRELETQLTEDRLVPILKEYGEYPQRYRHLIWSTLLNLPNNKRQFIELIKKGYHRLVKNYDKEYPIKDFSALRNLKKIVSCLIHWCNAFAFCDYLPMFVFPFLKIFPSNILLTFELIVTILLNHCQLWFEFLPMEPLNYLGIIENVLNEFDTELVEFYIKNQITAKIYALPLMKTAFSEVLDTKQWYKLWDHVISNQSYFLIFLIVSYNITQRNVIMKIQAQEAIEDYFHEQNIIDMKRFINRAYSLMNKCSDLIHPRRYMKPYEKLSKGFYQKFENYPKKWIELKDNEMEIIRAERENLDKKIRELEATEITLVKRLEAGLKLEEHEKRLKEVEQLYESTLQREQEKISCQRTLLLLYQKQIRERKAKVMQLVQESAYRRQMNLRENELNVLQESIQKAESHNELDMMFADDEMKTQEFDILEQKYNLEMNTINNQPKLDVHFKDAVNKLENEYEKLNFELKNLIENKSNTHSRQSYDTITEKMNKIERMLQKIQSQFFWIIKNKFGTYKKSELKKLEAQTNGLKKEAQELLQRFKS